MEEGSGDSAGNFVRHLRKRKQQTNHWFVAYEHGQELRVSGWNSQARLQHKSQASVRANLPAQACRRLHGAHHRVADRMRPMAEATVAMRHVRRILARASTPASPQRRRTRSRCASPHRSLISGDELESSRPSSCRRPMRQSSSSDLVFQRPIDLSFSSRAWRAEAWKREQERERRNGAQCEDIAAARSAA